MFILHTVGCAVVGDPLLLLTPDPTRTGVDGTHGPLGAAVAEFSAAARVTEVVPVDVIYPTEGDDVGGDGLTVAVSDAPTVVFIHGGLVPPERYHWLGAHFASRGYAVVMPRAELDLAIAQPGNGAVALEALREAAADDGFFDGLIAADGPVATMGHSLGGVMGTRQWVRDDAVDLNVVLASFAAGGDDVEAQGDRPVLAVSGTTDQSLEADRFVEETARFVNADRWLVMGLNHYGWTDEATDGELAGDGPLEGDLDTLRTQALALIDAHLDVRLQGAPEGRLEGPFDGLEAVP